LEGVSAFGTFQNNVIRPSYMVRYLWFLNQSDWFFLYRQKMSPLLSFWKSQGETKTMSPSRIQTRRFSLPLIRQRRSLPSWHLTIIRSAPNIFIAIPRTSFDEGRTILSRLPSFVIFLLPILSPFIRIIEKK